MLDVWNLEQTLRLQRCSTFEIWNKRLDLRDARRLKSGTNTLTPEMLDVWNLEQTLRFQTCSTFEIWNKHLDARDARYTNCWLGNLEKKTRFPFRKYVASSSTRFYKLFIIHCLTIVMRIYFAIIKHLDNLANCDHERKSCKQPRKRDMVFCKFWEDILKIETSGNNLQ